MSIIRMQSSWMSTSDEIYVLIRGRLKGNIIGVGNKDVAETVRPQMDVVCNLIRKKQQRVCFYW